ncbi:hypothetical protein KBD81_00070 [Candidatus Woesebacteria bacterium]|nr:hypothetical protein [Candidatus Woesebacteria bacterium]
MNITEYTGLFRQKEFVEGLPQRPLGDLSNFVVGEMPAILSQIREGSCGVDTFVQTADRLALSLSGDTVNPLLAKRSGPGFGGYIATNPHLMIAHLDATMLEAAIVHSGGVAPDILVELVNVLSDASDQVQGITYEAITYANPGGDMRTFTLDAQGNHHPAEVGFYQGHPTIDRALGEAAMQIKSVISSFGDSRISVRRDEALAYADAIICQVNTLMQHYRSPELTVPFAEFRPYLASHPTRGLKGPSGAFSPAIPVLDILVAGSTLPDFMMEYIRDNFRYFPRQGRVDIQDALEMSGRQESLTDVLKQHSEIGALVERIRSQLRGFRGHHRGAVGAQLKDVMVGTAGEQIGEFLGERMKVHHAS